MSLEIKVMNDILKKNDELAVELNSQLTAKEIFALNLLGSPGCGKTSLLEQTIRRLQGSLKVAIIEGDLYTSKDADRIAACGAQVIQINTYGGCHLDASMIKSALDNILLDEVDVLVIENVGNLVCPAEFAVGEHVKVVVLSITEGEDKPLKYPNMFRQAEAVILNKVDLLPYTDFSIDSVVKDIRSLNPRAELFEVSCRTGQGLSAWIEWLTTRTDQIRRERKIGL